MKVPLWALLLGSIAYGFIFSLAFPIIAPQEKIKVRAQEENIEYPLDPRVLTLEAYLLSKNSPLKDNATTFITAADVAGLDWRLLPAISGVESGFGKALLQNSYNPFGWGGGYIKFQSFDDAIFTVALSLKISYVEKGAETVPQIAPIYCPPNSEKWSRGVSFFMSQIGKPL